MLRAQRFREIENALARQPFMDVKSLADSLRVSNATIRRDLDVLEREGRLARTWGGAMQRGDGAATESPNGNGHAEWANETTEHVAPFAQRVNLRLDEKAAIGEAAARLIGDGQSVLIAGGTTCYAAARHLRYRRVSVVTNSLPTAALLGETLGVDVVVTGGMVYPKHDILIGPQLVQTLASVHTGDWLLLGAGGADSEGFYDSNHWEVEAQLALMGRANKVALLLDAAKFGRRDMVFVARWEQIDVLVTDAPPPAPVASALAEAEVEVVVAG